MKAKRNSVPSPRPCRTRSGPRGATANSTGSTTGSTSTAARRRAVWTARRGARSFIPTICRPPLRQWRDAVASGTTYECEFRIRRADGVFRWHIARALPIRDNAGRIVRWIGTNTDIEDQKSAARALERLNKTLEQQVAESVADRDRMWRLSTDMMLVADFQSNIVAVNPAWQQTPRLG